MKEEFSLLAAIIVLLIAAATVVVYCWLVYKALVYDSIGHGLVLIASVIGWNKYKEKK